MEVSTHTPGSFCISVLRTRDIERAAAFYTSLVGWDALEVPGTAGGHRLLQRDGKTVASLHQATDTHDHWVPHVSVLNAERTAADAEALGASRVDTTDIANVARLATLRDPEGALFGLWQPAPHRGAELMEQVGSLWWIELMSHDVAGARRFYERLFGWTSIDTSFEPIGAYTVFKRGDVQEGGLSRIHDEWDMSPRWNSIFEVEDCDATLERACTLGGSSLFVHNVPKHGRIGGLDDPGGAWTTVRGPIPAATSG